MSESKVVYVENETLDEDSVISLNEITKRVEQAVPGLRLRGDFRQMLEANNAGLQEVAATLGDILYSEKNKDRLRAAEMIMKSLGLFDTERGSDASITFNVQGKQVNLQTMLQPFAVRKTQVSTEEDSSEISSKESI